MRRNELLSLQSEQKFLAEQLNKLPAAAKLTRRSTEARLRSVTNKIDVAAPLGVVLDPASTRITFRGRPVLGSHGIMADFGLTATRAFADAVSTIAASTVGRLAPMGPIPNRNQHQLVVTGTAIGSFGFELEEIEQLPLDGDTPVREALHHTQTFLNSTLGTDEELSDVIAETDRRALDKIRAFLQVLADNEAVCAVETGAETFRFQNVDQVKASVRRIGNDNVVEDEEELTGRFEGVMQHRRTFEFRPTNAQDFISGRIDPEAGDPATIIGSLDRTFRIRVTRTRVGIGRPRFRLVSALALD